MSEYHIIGLCSHSIESRRGLECKKGICVAPECAKGQYCVSVSILVTDQLLAVCDSRG